MDYLGRWLGDERQWVTLKNLPLTGSQLRHWNITLYGHTTILSTLSHLVMKLLKIKLMQFLPLSNDH